MDKKKFKIDQKILSIYLTIIIVAIIIRLIILGISNFEFRYNTLKRIRDSLRDLEQSQNYYIYTGDEYFQKQGNKTYTQFYDKQNSIYYDYLFDGNDTIYYYSSDSYKFYSNNVKVKLNSEPKTTMKVGFDEYKNLSDFDLFKIAMNIFSYKIYRDVLYDPTYDPAYDFQKVGSYYIEYVVIENKDKEIVCFDPRTFLPTCRISADGFIKCNMGESEIDPFQSIDCFEIIDEVDYKGEIY